MRVVGGLLLCYFSFSAFLLAFFFRLDTAGELPEVLEYDVIHGAGFAVSVFLVGIPPVGRTTAKWFGLLTLASLLSWGIVSGCLRASHMEQHRIRSTPPKDAPPRLPVD